MSATFEAALYALRDSQGTPTDDGTVSVSFTALCSVMIGGHDAIAALRPFAGIKADDGDDYSTYPDAVIIRCEVSVREIKAARAMVGPPIDSGSLPEGEDAERLSAEQGRAAPEEGHRPTSNCNADTPIEEVEPRTRARQLLAATYEGPELEHVRRAVLEQPEAEFGQWFHHAIAAIEAALASRPPVPAKVAHLIERLNIQAGHIADQSGGTAKPHETLYGEAAAALEASQANVARLEAILGQALAEKKRDGPISGDHWTVHARATLGETAS